MLGMLFHPMSVRDRCPATVRLIALLVPLLFHGQLPAVSAQDSQPTTTDNAEATTDNAAANSEAKPQAPEKSKLEILEEIPVELRPYRVLVSFAFESTSQFSGSFRPLVIQEFTDFVDRNYGQMWELKTEVNPWLMPVSRDSLRQVSQESLKGRYLLDDWDKVFLVSVSVSGADYHVSSLEYDTITEVASPPVTTRVVDRRRVAAAAFAVVGQTFHPIVHIESAEIDVVKTRLLAGELFPTNPEARQLREGSLLQPFFRYRDTKRVVRDVKPVPWTYLDVTNVNRARITCQVHSALRMALTGANRRRVDSVATVVRPIVDETDLSLTLTQYPDKQLIGHRVSVIYGDPKDQDAEPEFAVLLSDRDGRVTIPVKYEVPLVWLFVRSGNSTLVRVPFVPGASKAVTIQLPDDSVRLDTEGKVALLQSELIDTVARRAVLMALALGRAKEDDWETADRYIAEAGELPKADVYRARLTGIEVPGVDGAQAQRNRVAESRIRKMCNDLRGQIERYLEGSSLDEVNKQIADLRRGKRPAQ